MHLFSCFYTILVDFSLVVFSFFFVFVVVSRLSVDILCLLVVVLCLFVVYFVSLLLLCISFCWVCICYKSSCTCLWTFCISLRMFYGSLRSDCVFSGDILQVRPLAPLCLCPVGLFSNPSMTVSSDFSQVFPLCGCLQEMPGEPLHSPNVKTHTPPTLLHSSTPPPGSVIFVLHHHTMPSYARKSLHYNTHYSRAWKLFRTLQLLWTIICEK